MLTINFKTCSGRDDEEYKFRFNKAAATALCCGYEGIITLDIVLAYAVKRIFGPSAFYQRALGMRGFGQIFRNAGNVASSVTGQVELSYFVNGRNVGEEDAWAEFERIAGEDLQRARRRYEEKYRFDNYSLV